MNNQKYINVLKTTLKPSFCKLFSDTNMEGIKNQQDNAPCHKSVTSMQWIRQNNIDFKLAGTILRS